MKVLSSSVIYIDHMKFCAYVVVPLYHNILGLFCITLYMVICLVWFCLIL